MDSINGPDGIGWNCPRCGHAVSVVFCYIVGYIGYIALPSTQPMLLLLLPRVRNLS